MAHLTGNTRANWVQGMFSRIAPVYDRVNTLMTVGQDRHWRRFAVKMTGLPKEKCLLLDLGGGTGGLGIQAGRDFPNTIPVVTDFSVEMMRVGKKRQGAELIQWLEADGLNLPYPGEIFDAVVSGFFLRNVVNRHEVLKEQFRVIKPGCRVVILETSPSKRGFLRPLVYIYVHWIIPLLGRMFSGDGAAYHYLSDSSEGFLSAEDLKAQMADVGFQNIGFMKFKVGTIAVHWGEK